MAGKNNKTRDLREACVKEALAIVAKGGLDALSLRDVARRLGVSHQAPYKHFPSREHILAEVVSRAYSSFAGHLAKRTRSDDPYRDLGHLGQSYLDYARKHPLHYQLMFGTPLPDPAEHPEMMSQARQAFAMLREAIGKLPGRSAHADSLFLVVEPLIGQVIEPLVYGHSTGLTPVAVIIAATFWTWLWGPIGLLLSTPLTVCLGVLGRHIPWLRFLDVMIGDDPPLSSAQSFYQRALAGDIDEAVDQAVEILPRRSLSYVYDNVVLEALHLAQIDFRRGLLDSKHVERMNEAVHELIADTIEYEDITPPVGAQKDNGSAPGEKSDEPPSLPDVRILRDFPLGSGAKPVLCVSGRGPFDEAVAKMRIQLLEKHGLGGRVEDNAAVSSSNIVHLNNADVKVICLSYLALGSSPAHLRHSLKRIRRQIASATLIVGLWGHADDENREHLQTATADFYVLA